MTVASLYVFDTAYNTRVALSQLSVHGASSLYNYSTSKLTNALAGEASRSLREFRRDVLANIHTCTI